jgi:hypothetical protein
MGLKAVTLATLALVVAATMRVDADLADADARVA